jgi:ubiquinone/menaquinone biosynthesis C-methylase UbiE
MFSKLKNILKPKKKTNINYHAWADTLTNLPKSYRDWFAEEKKYLQKIITLDSKVLEVGCGDGRSIFDILSITKNIIGIDYDNKAVANAQNNFNNYPSVKIIEADATNLPFQDMSFDFVICMTTFANFNDKKFIALEEMKRVLKKDGKIIISVFSEDALKERLKVYKVMKSEIKKIENGTVIFGDDGVSEQFSNKQLEDIFNKVHLQIEDITKVNIAYLCTLSFPKSL